MSEIIEGLGRSKRERMAALRRQGTFFWVDVSLSETGRDALGEALSIPTEALGPLVGIREDTPPSRMFHSDGERVIFAFTCFLEPTELPAGTPGPLRPIEVHLLIGGEYLLTVHEERLSLPELLSPDLPDGRGERYTVYAIIDAMVATGFDALNDAELSLERLMSSDMHTSRGRIVTQRAISSRLRGMRRRLGPQRGIFERVSEEIEQIEGLKADREPYFERIDAQLNRLIDGIDAAADGLANLIDLRLNETIYWLTVVATIFLPITFVTGFFGMNFNWMIDRIDTFLAFALLGIGGCVLGVAVTVLLVRRRGTPVEPDRSKSFG